MFRVPNVSSFCWIAAIRSVETSATIFSTRGFKGAGAAKPATAASKTEKLSFSTISNRYGFELFFDGRFFRLCLPVHSPRLELHRHQFRHTGLLHRDPIQRLRRFHGALGVRDHD